MAQRESTRGTGGMKSVAEALLSYGSRAALTQNGYGSLLMKMVVVSICLEFGTMQTVVTR
jgi:hypothetical protein